MPDLILKNKKYIFIDFLCCITQLYNKMYFLDINQKNQMISIFDYMFVGNELKEGKLVIIFF